MGGKNDSDNKGDKNLYNIEENNGGRKVTAVSKYESGQVDMSITTVSPGGNTSHSYRVGVTTDDRVYVTDTNNSHNGSTSDFSGELGNKVDHKLAQQIRKAYKGFTKDNVIDPQEVEGVHDVIQKAMNKVPTQHVSSKKDGPSF